MKYIYTALYYTGHQVGKVKYCYLKAPLMEERKRHSKEMQEREQTH